MPTKKQFASLMKDPRVIDAEDEGADEGRFFVHLREGFDWCIDPKEVRRSASFGSMAEARAALRRVKQVQP